MKHISKINSLYLLLASLLLILTNCKTQDHQQVNLQDTFPNVLDVQNTPAKPVDWDSFFFADQGAWFGFALPDSNQVGISGPFLMTNGRWLGKSILNLKFYDKDLNPINQQSVNSIYYPGKLVQEINYPNFSAKLTLIFVSSNQSLIHIEFKDFNTDTKVYPEWSGSVFSSEGNIIPATDKIVIKESAYNSELNILFHQNNISENLSHTDTTYTCILSPMKLSETISISALVSFNDDNTKISSQLIDQDIIQNPVIYLEQNNKRWNNYLNKALESNADWSNKKEYQHIAVKSVETLINNWRCPYGDLFHDGLFPSASVNYFNGFWAWDSWKHAVALVRFEPELAKNQIRAMYDYQNTDGMIADCIYSDSTYNNWLNTKPPLSGWAIWEVFKETKDTAFVKEMYPKLLKYHEWWYQYRDLNHNSLCEYGSSDGSLIAAKWESGMDNAIRFDNSTIVKINKANYAFSQESVDLNAYLYFEKQQIAKMANILGLENNFEKYTSEASKIKDLIESKMYHIQSGYYYDINLQTSEIVPVQGPEGWIPLFTQLASAEKAKTVSQIMLDTSKFCTYIPFPTAPKDDPEFSEGYWRGPIWLDQVYFAITALNNYGYTFEANEYTLQVFNRLEGLKQQAPIRENYWPLTGEGMRVNHFSWSAAHLLLLYQQQ